ncbi:DNA-directed RNA polymerase subunit A'' [uncultured archaeon]|nr:DNA-directed RNA polymerase subunit A'' [uncultured archaeon]
MQKLDVDRRHLNVLADAMCMEGVIKSVGRHGLSGEKASILARAAFEETIKHLINAAIKGEEDKLVGVTENIIVGQYIPVGTGIVKLSMQRKK